MKRSIAILAALAVVALMGTGCQKLKARDQLNRGVQAYRNAQYAQAVENFKTAVDLDPTFPTARLYLATAYMTQYIPGAESPENEKMAKAAFDQFHKVLEQDARNELATASIASLYYNQKKWDEAEEWYKKLVAINPKNREAYYTLGVIAWTRWIVPDREARVKLGMRPEDPGPIKDKKLRAGLRDKYMPTLDGGIKNIQEALRIDPEYDDAMAYMNLLIRYRADLLDTPDEYKKQTEIADDWVQKSLQTKRIKAERKPVGGGITAEEPK
jgi:Tfp pilus assembly protein PilF